MRPFLRRHYRGRFPSQPLVRRFPMQVVRLSQPRWLLRPDRLPCVHRRHPGLDWRPVGLMWLSRVYFRFEIDHVVGRLSWKWIWPFLKVKRPLVRRLVATRHEKWVAVKKKWTVFVRIFIYFKSCERYSYQGKRVSDLLLFFGIFGLCNKRKKR